jgi:hypothetical protein
MDADEKMELPLFYHHDMGSHRGNTQKFAPGELAGVRGMGAGCIEIEYAVSGLKVCVFGDARTLAEIKNRIPRVEKEPRKEPEQPRKAPPREMRSGVDKDVSFCHMCFDGPIPVKRLRHCDQCEAYICKVCYEKWREAYRMTCFDKGKRFRLADGCPACIDAESGESVL